MAETAGAIIGVIQRALGDPEGTFALPTFCIGYVNDAQVSVGNKMRANGIERFQKQTPSPITIPAGTGYTQLDRTSTPALPADFLEPIQMWEKASGRPDTDYRIVTLLRGDIPPTQIADTSIRNYSWFNGKIKFQTPTADVQILLDYICSLTDFTSPTDAVPVYNTVLAIGYKAAALIAEGREDMDATILEARADAELHNILVEANAFSQRKPIRRRPFVYGPFPRNVWYPR